MPHTYVQNTVHIVFSTKDRCKSIPPEFRSELWSYVAGICKNHKIAVHAIGGTDDHIHLLVQVPATVALAKTVLTIKSNSSRWAHDQGHKFAWQENYAAFSVSASLIPTVVRYIQNQEAHHRKICFDVEFIALLKKHGVDYDAKWVLG
ncbi:MAG: IS200/IS605 family transposase [Candidatus Acidiferrales bacterium]